MHINNNYKKTTYFICFCLRKIMESQKSVFLKHQTIEKKKRHCDLKTKSVYWLIHCNIFLENKADN